MPWIPNFGLELWPKDNEPLRLKEAQADQSSRSFIVSYVLEDPPTRQIEHSQIALENFVRVDIMAPGGVKIPMQLEKTDKGRLGVISFRLEIASTQRAIEQTYPWATLQISFWSVVMGIPIAIYGLTVRDEKYGVDYVGRPQVGSAERFWLPEGIGLGEDWRVILALYREGKASSSPYFQFFMFFRVLEGFYERADRLTGQVRRLMEKRGLSFIRPKGRLTREMLMLAMAPPDFVQKWEGKSFGEFYRHLDHTHRLRIAHTFPKNRPPLNPDSWFDYHETVFLSNVLDQIARALITGCLERMVVPTRDQFQDTNQRD
jgi:hypothetical protein